MTIDVNILFLNKNSSSIKTRNKIRNCETNEAKA
jgi:hypothetical protein